MKKLMKELEKAWMSTDMRYRGQNPACDRMLDDIEAKLRAMDTEEMFSQLDKLSSLQLEEILPVLDNLWEDDYDMKKYIDLAME